MKGEQVYAILKKKIKDGSSGGDGVCDICQTATDEEVKRILDQIFSGPPIEGGGHVPGGCCETATDQEVEAVLKQIFNG